MRKILCKILGCNYKYYFSVSNSFSKRQDVRICTYCLKMQHYKQVPNLNKYEFVWSTMVKFTDNGAYIYWESKTDGMFNNIKSN